MRGKQKQILLIGGTSFLILTVLVILFFQLVTPHIDARVEAEQQLEQEEVLIAQLERQVREEQEEAAAHPETSTEQQRRLPVVRMTDQFLLDLSMAEELSGTRILDIEMTYDHPVYRYETIDILPQAEMPEEESDAGDVREEEEETEQEVEVEAEAEVDEENGTNVEVDVETEAPADSEEEIPSNNEEERTEAAETGERTAGALQAEVIEGMRKQTATVELNVNNYAALSLFLEELDGLRREVNVESVLFMGEEEDRIFDGETDIFYEVQVSSFYYPDLEELEHETPVADYPEEESSTSPFLD